MRNGLDEDGRPEGVVEHPAVAAGGPKRREGQPRERLARRLVHVPGDDVGMAAADAVLAALDAANEGLEHVGVYLARRPALLAALEERLHLGGLDAHLVLDAGVGVRRLDLLEGRHSP